MASVQKITGKLKTTYRVQIMRNGQRIGKSFSTKKAADLFLARITADDDLAEALTDVNLNSILFKDAASAFLNDYRGRDQSVIRRLTWWANRLGSKPVGKITPQLVMAGLTALAKDEKAPATINKTKACLSSFFKWFNKQHLTRHNPCREIAAEPENNARKRFLSDDEMRRLLDACERSTWERLYLLVHMALVTGARRSELLGLRWSDLDFQSKTATLHLTKNGETRSLALTTALIEELMQWREIGEAYLFPNPRHLYEPMRNFDRFWYSALLAADIKDFRFHDLRHTSASIMAKTDASLLELADHLGHKSMTMVKRYAHLCTGHKVEKAESTFGDLTRRAAR
ncbi:tyrosine-type recombinase/integrase [Aeromonas caviae]|uniref:tyrosine-type recombinase/integrase n=1 Tax=Aeromonas caviae TaxID=648 RepID=UPI001FFD47A9|nr:site-specific integrase [Aeromonas caviae]MCK2070719.1 site-specific integrase [Aeromonas caviae]